jgi:hypothetical protein
MNNCKIKLCGGKIQLPPTYVPEVILATTQVNNVRNNVYAREYHVKGVATEKST